MDNSLNRFIKRKHTRANSVLLRIIGFVMGKDLITNRLMTKALREMGVNKTTKSVSFVNLFKVLELIGADVEIEYRITLPVSKESKVVKIVVDKDGKLSPETLEKFKELLEGETC